MREKSILGQPPRDGVRPVCLVKNGDNAHEQENHVPHKP